MTIEPIIAVDEEACMAAMGESLERDLAEQHEREINTLGEAEPIVIIPL